MATAKTGSREQIIHFKTKLENAYWDWKLGISTRGVLHSQLSDDEHIHYGTRPYEHAFAVVERLDLRADDVFVDLGCGKGRVVCVAALKLIHEAIGIDDEKQLCTIARRNAQNLRGRSAPISIVEQKVQESDLSRGTAYYMFHAFGPTVLQNVVDRLRRGLEAKPRNIRIAYSTPVHQDVLAKCGWLEEYDGWARNVGSPWEEVVTFWRNRG